MFFKKDLSFKINSNDQESKKGHPWDGKKNTRVALELSSLNPPQKISQSPHSFTARFQLPPNKQNHPSQAEQAVENCVQPYLLFNTVVYFAKKRPRSNIKDKTRPQ